jgi:uncharacterized repeat protein (TIGR01451 family)
MPWYCPNNSGFDMSLTRLQSFMLALCASTASPLALAAAPDDIAIANIRAWFDALDTQAQTYSSTTAIPTYPGNVGTGISATLISSWLSKVNGYDANSSFAGLTAPSTSNTYPGIGALYNSGDDSLAVQGDIWGANAVVTTPEVFMVTSPITAPVVTTFLFASQRARANTAARITAHFPWNDGNIYWDPTCCGAGRNATYAPANNQLVITNWYANASARFVISNATNNILTGSAGGSYTNASSAAAPSFYTLGGAEAGNSYRGVISENIVYNRLLFIAEKRILNNYFAAKWGIDIGADSRYGGAAASNGLYRYHVGGIGAEASGNQTNATSEGLSIGNGSFLAAGRYLVAGLPGLSAAGTMTAYNQSIAGTTAKVITAPQLLRGKLATDLPISAFWRGARVWYLDKTDASNSTGTVTLSFDLSGKMGLANPNDDGSAVATGQPLQLLFRSAQTGTFTTVITANAASAASVTFTVPANLLASGYYTVGDYRPPKPALAKTVTPVSDPINGTSNPKNIPGAIVTYTVKVSNEGESPLITSSSNSLTILDIIPPNLDMNTSVTASCTNAGAQLTLAPANVTYYSDAGATAVIAPTPGFDANVRAVRLFPQGQLDCPDTTPKCPLPHTAIPSCSFSFNLRIK